MCNSTTIKPRLKGNSYYSNEENPYMDSGCPYMGGFILVNRAAFPIYLHRLLGENKHTVAEITPTYLANLFQGFFEYHR